MIRNPATPAPQARPYRSHRYPACLRCRSRKIKCEIDVPGQPCRFCRGREEACQYATTISEEHIGILPNSIHSSHDTPPAKRRRVSNGRAINKVTPTATVTAAQQGNNASPTESALILNPQMAEDVVLLEQSLSARRRNDPVVLKPYRTISNVPGDPVVYLAIPRKREGYGSSNDPGRQQRTIIEQILRPWSVEVLSLYCEQVHPCFPVLPENVFDYASPSDRETASSAVFCDLYAIALPFWRQSAVLRDHSPPDSHFIWNQAVAALQHDFMAPTISTLQAAMLDLMGRPVIQVNGNIVNTGRVVTLAQSFGLNRNSNTWNITLQEKILRISLWWGVVLHDHFSSICHGIPPNINPNFYDVPLPTVDMLATSTSLAARHQELSTFVSLCGLTSILGKILPLVYTLKLNITDAERTIRRVECDLDSWSAQLPERLNWLSPSSPSTVNGAANLWFAFLSIKLLVARLLLRVAMENPVTTAKSEACKYRMAVMRETAIQVMDFVIALTNEHLHQFWMPYASYLLITATTILLRCTVESADIATKKACAAKLVAFRKRLENAVECGWDIAEACLERCSEPIQKVAEAFEVLAEQDVSLSEESRDANDAIGSSHPEESALPDTLDTTSELFLPMDSLDQLWEIPWDTIDNFEPS